MTEQEKMAIVSKVMQDRTLPNRPRPRLERMKALGLNVSHDEMLRLWSLYRDQALRKFYKRYKGNNFG